MWAPPKTGRSGERNIPHTPWTNKYIVTKRIGCLVAKSRERDGLGEGSVYDGERTTTYGDSDDGRRRRRGSAGEQTVQSAQDRMEYDAHGGGGRVNYGKIILSF